MHTVYFNLLPLDDIRKDGWPALLGIDPTQQEILSSEESLRAHPEYSQVVLDVNRSLKRFPPGIPYQQRVALQDQLTNLILRVITKYPHLRYYQVNLILDPYTLLFSSEIERTLEASGHSERGLLARRNRSKLYRFLRRTL